MRLAQDSTVSIALSANFRRNDFAFRSNELARAASLDYLGLPALEATSQTPSTSIQAPFDEAEVERAVELLTRGQVIGLPTETVYGLAADGTDSTAVRRIFELKGRPANHPLILHLAEASWLERFAVRVPETAHLLARRFWPGPLTLVVPRAESVPVEVTGGLETVALRVPGHRVALEVLKRFNRPVAAPSANLFGRVSPTTRAHVVHDFGDAIPLVLDGGPCEEGVESTIVDLSGPTPRILRHGSISRAQIEQALEQSVGELTQIQAGDVRAPGMLASHYAPRAPLFLCKPEDLSAVLRERRALHPELPLGVVTEETAELDLDYGEAQYIAQLPDLSCARYFERALRPSHSDSVSAHASLHGVLISGGPRGVARSIYAALRYLDELNVNCIVATMPIADDVGRAVQDRLGRAAAPRPSSALSE